MLQRARGKVRQAREALKADAGGNADRAAGHGGLSSDLLELAAVTEAVELTHGGTGSENKKKTELATPKQPGPQNASAAATPTAAAAAAAAGVVSGAELELAIPKVSRNSAAKSL